MVDRIIAPRPRGPATFRSGGDALAWAGGIVLTVGAFTGWYAVTIDGARYAVVAWNTGTLGKLTFVAGLAALVLLVLRATGFEPPPALSGGLLHVLLGAAATIFVLIRVFSVPSEIQPAERGVGIWISLGGAAALLAGGLLRAARER